MCYSYEPVEVQTRCSEKERDGADEQEQEQEQEQEVPVVDPRCMHSLTRTITYKLCHFDVAISLW